MSPCRLLSIGTILIFAVTAHAQESTPSAGASTQRVSDAEHAGLPSVESQLKVLTEKLGLSAEQQERVRPIMQGLHDTTERLMQDKNLSHEERLARVRPERYKADERIRAELSEDQKKKLDAYERGPHPEMHGPLSGTATPTRPPSGN